MFSEKIVASGIPLVVDVAGRGITELSQIPGGGREVAALTADNNKLVSLKGIHTFSSLIQCSMCSNSLVNISAVSSLTRLVTLNLQNNSITAIEGLGPLVHLEWLGLAGNSIKVMSGLSGNTRLAHLDLSDNCITELGNISMLRSLKTLLLHGNAVTLLKSIPECFPSSLTTLSLAENHVQDLNEVSFLSALPDLSEVSVMGNPCVSLTHHSMLFDYRPYVVYWCHKLSTLDGITITAEERLRSVSLFHSDHAYPFRLGQHQSLVEYLMTACPLPVLQNQVYPLPGQSVSFDPLSHTLLTQALSLENPQQKADVMQKLRVLQVLEQMISQQENLLNTQQQHQQLSEIPPAKISKTADTSTNTGNILETRDRLSPHSGKELTLDSDAMNSGDLNGSLADTTLTGDTRSDNDVIRPQPSLPFNIVDGLSQYSRRNGHERVRIAWAEGGSANDDIMPHGARESEGGETEEEGEVGDGVEEREGKGVQLEDVDGPDCDTLTAGSSIQSLSVQSMGSNVDNLNLLPPATAVCTTTSDMGMGNVTQGNELPGMEPGKTANVAASSKYAEQGVASHSESTLHSESSPLSTSITTPHVTSTSSPTPSLVVTSVSIPGVSSAEEMRREYSDIPLQTSSASGITNPSSQSTVEQTASVEDDVPLFVTSDPSFEDTDTAEGGPLEVKYSSSVDPPANKEGESSLPQSPLHHTDILESDSQFLPLPGDRIETSPAREWDLSSLASSLSQAYGIADFSERTNLLATLTGRHPPPAHDDWEFEGESTLVEGTARSDREGTETVVGVGGEVDGGEEGRRKEIKEMGLGQRQSDYEEKQALAPTDEKKEERKDVEKYTKPKNQTSYRNPGNQTSSVGEQNSLSVNRTATATNAAHDILSQTILASKVPPQSAKSTSLSQHDAAMTIQARVRGYLCRKGVNAYKTRQRAATIIQATWRGFQSRRCDCVVEVRRELNRKKMECYVPTMYFQLKGCREEMAHQAQILQLQEETIASLIQEVESLHEWRGGIEKKTLRKAAITIQRYWRGYWARKEMQKKETDSQSSQHVESLWSLCCELRQQVRDLEKKMALLQEGYIQQRNRNTDQTAGSSLPAPSKLTMRKHSSDTILLQWTASDGVCDSSLLGYRVYVNGTEEGMVGPTKHKAYIEGLDTSTTYRVSVRAVYDHGESEDSNMLLVASLNPRTEDEQSTPTPTSSQNEVVSLPRSFQPPAPTQLPEIVQKSSTLSKSESCSTLETLSVENSATIESRSMSANQLGGVLCQQTDLPVILHPPVDQTNTSGDETLLTVQQTGTVVNESPYSESTGPVSHHASMHSQPQLIASDVNTGDVFLRQEIGHELSRRYDEVDQQPPTTHNHTTATSASYQTTTGTDPASQGQAEIAGEVQHEQEPTSAGSNFTEEEASSLACEADQSPTVEQHCTQTQPPLRSSDKKTGTLHTPMGSNSHSPAIPVINESVPCSTHHYKTESATEISDTALKRARAPSPLNQRSPRLAAVFVHTQAGVSTFSQSSNPCANSTHTTQLSSLTLQSDLASVVCPALQPNKGGVFVGSTQSAEQTDTNGLFSGKEQNKDGKGMTGKGLTDQKRVMSHNNSHEHFQGMHMGEFGQLPLATTGNTSHLVSHTCQPALETTQKNPNECQAPSLSLPTSHSSAV